MGAHQRRHQILLVDRDAIRRTVPPPPAAAHHWLARPRSSPCPRGVPLPVPLLQQPGPDLSVQEPDPKHGPPPRPAGHQRLSAASDTVGHHRARVHQPTEHPLGLVGGEVASGRQDLRNQRCREPANQRDVVEAQPAARGMPDEEVLPTLDQRPVHPLRHLMAISRP